MNEPEEGAESVPWVLADALVDMLNEATAERDEYKRLHAHASDLYEMFRRKYDEEGDRSDRYRSAWLSARRRAAKESEFAAEALALKDAEIARLTARLNPPLVD